MIRRAPLLPLALALVAGAALAQSGATRTLDLTEGDDLALAQKVNAAVEQVSAQVGACMGKGGAAPTCLCQTKPALIALKAAAETALARRPDWAGADVALRWSAQGKTVVLMAAASLAEARRGLTACGG